MANAVAKPTPVLQIPDQDNYDPCALAKPCSPFYLYNHDSPRPSMDNKSKPSMQVSVQDIELGDADLSPTVSNEKLAAQQKPKGIERLKFWKNKKDCRIRTTRKQKGCIARLPHRQRIAVKVAITLLVIGCMVGIAVGISVGLKSTVWKSNNQVGKIGA